MPFTPFHIGPGLLCKAVLKHRISLSAFAVSQVLIDIEPLIGLIRGVPHLHGWSHTYLAAVPLALCASALTFWLKPKILSVMEKQLRMHGISCSPEIISSGWLPLIYGSLLGTLSHVFLDSVMHFDMQPFAPFSENNHLLYALSVLPLHLACVVSGIAGAALLAQFIKRILPQ